MKIGDIIRSAQGIGRYILITDIYKDQVFGRYLSKFGYLSDETLIPMGKYDIMNVYRLQISEEEFNKLSIHSTCIKHEATASWDSLVDIMEERGVDLIMFYRKQKKIYYTFSGVKRTFSLIWNRYHTRCSKKPCITILLENLVIKDV